MWTYHNRAVESKYQAIIEKTRELWDFTTAIPTPIGDWLRCGICGHKDYQRRNARYFKRDAGESGYPYRVDVSFKCKRCAFVWTHGLLIDEQTWMIYVERHGHVEQGAKVIYYQLRNHVE